MIYLTNFLFTVSVIFPLVALMLGGFIARQKSLVSEHTANQCNNLVFKIFLPILLFNNVRGTTIESISSPWIFIFILVTIPVMFLLVTFIIVAIEKDNSKRGVMVQGICRSNYAIFGLPLVALLHPGEDLAIASTLVAAIIPSYNVCSIIVLTIFGGGKINIRRILKSLASNNLIIATLLGVVLMITGVELPEMINNMLNYFAAVATPLALFMLGAKFDFSCFSKVGKQLIITCVGRLVVLPTIVITIAIMLGFRGVELTCLMIMFYAPTAASSYVMAVEMGGDGDLAASTVVTTTVLSVVSMFLVIFSFVSLGFI